MSKKKLVVARDYVKLEDGTILKEGDPVPAGVTLPASMVRSS